MPLPVIVLVAYLFLIPLSALAEPGAPASSAAALSDSIVAVVATDLPPTYYKDPETGQPVGFAVDVMDEVARRAGLRVTYVYGRPWEEMAQMVLSGRADVNPSLIINDARKQVLLFTDPVETMPINYIVRASDSMSGTPRPGMKIGMMRGSTAEEYFKGRDDVMCVTFDSMHQLLMELLAGRIDLVMTATPNILKLAIDTGVEDRIRVIEPPVMEGKRAIALRPDDVALQQRLNRAIDAFIGTPQYQALYAKWWGKPQPYWTTKRVALVMGLMLLGVAAALFSWRFVSVEVLNRRLRAEVAEREAANARLQQTIETARELADKARLANLAKSEFLANMSHELRTPLTGVLGMLQLLESGNPTGEQRGWIDAASRSGWQLKELLDDLLDLSRLEAGKLTLEEMDVDLARLADSVVDLFALQAQQKGLQLAADIDPELPRAVRGDAKRLRQILLNLVGNAVKFTPGGRVALWLRPAGPGADGRPRLQMLVEDTGIGIPAEHLERMFEPFVQGDLTYRKSFQGAGLGLTLVKRLVEKMGGELRIASTPGAGTTVTVEVPAEAAPRQPVPAAETPAPAAAPGKPLHILLAEDNEENLMLISLILSRNGHTVVPARNGREALERLAGEDFDLVLMDIQMPVMDGLTALEHIRGGRDGVRNPSVPVVALTAYAMSGDREKFLAAGMDGYLAKPIKLDILDRLIARFAGPLPIQPA